MEYLNIFLTMLSMAGGAFAWYQANGSRKAREDAAAAVERAELQAKSAHAQAYEARKQAEATRDLVDALKSQVVAAEQAAAEAKRLADSAGESNRLAEGHLAEFKKIADALRGPDFKVSPAGRNSYLLTYNGDMPVEVSVANRADFLKLSLDEGSFVLSPGESVQFQAFGAGGQPVPSNLVLTIVGRDEHVRLALVRSS